jgi:hypothetical protein
MHGPQLQDAAKQIPDASRLPLWTTTVILKEWTAPMPLAHPMTGKRQKPFTSQAIPPRKWQN